MQRVDERFLLEQFTTQNSSISLLCLDIHRIFLLINDFPHFFRFFVFLVIEKSHPKYKKINFKWLEKIFVYHWTASPTLKVFLAFNYNAKYIEFTDKTKTLKKFEIKKTRRTAQDFKKVQSVFFLIILADPESQHRLKILSIGKVPQTHNMILDWTKIESSFEEEFIIHLCLIVVKQKWPVVNQL